MLLLLSAFPGRMRLFIDDRLLLIVYLFDSPLARLIIFLEKGDEKFVWSSGFDSGLWFLFW